MLVCVVLSCLVLVALWLPAGKGLTPWVSCFATFPIVSWSTSELRRGWRRETGLSPPVKYFTDRSKAVLLLWIFYVFLSCVCYAFVRVYLFVPCGHVFGKG